MSTKFFTNRDGNSLIKKFKGVFEHVDVQFFDALIGYFRASGYFKLREAIGDKSLNIRILAGINVDILTKKYHDRGQYYIDNPEETKEVFVQRTIADIEQASYDEATEIGINQFFQDLIGGVIELRAHPTKKLHAKVYILRPNNFNEHTSGNVITGSSNLTDAGLGTNDDANYEFNVILRDYEDVKFASEEFERLWNESIPILKAEAEGIKKSTHLRDDFTPFELYIKMLMEYFGKRVEYDPYSIDSLMPEKYIKLKYQSDAANEGYHIMMKHNGFILADVVGLGKTIVACMILRKFIYENGTHTKVLVVVPPALEEGWQRTAKDFLISNNISFVTIGSLKKVTDEAYYDLPNADNIDMVVVDESHKFRNEDSQMYRELQKICKSPRSRPTEDGDALKKVILISATPLNNRPEDIENQLYLFQDKRRSTLEGVDNLQDYFKEINTRYKRLSEEEELDIPALRRLFSMLKADILEPLVVRRTRLDIRDILSYKEDLESQNISFPEVGDPEILNYNLDKKLSSLFLETVSVITALDEHGGTTAGLGYYRYRAIEYLVKEEDRKIYGNVGLISNRLAALMKTLLVKRLESSFHAFKESLKRLETAINNMIDMFDRDTVFIAPDLNINKLLWDGYSYEQIEEKVNEKGKNNNVYSAIDFNSDFYQLLHSDKLKVESLNARWGEVKSDPKLAEFQKAIDRELFDSERNHSGKLVIFSESKETTKNLYEMLDKMGQKKVLEISAENRKQKNDIIRENFDANLEKEKQKNDFDIIITTEVLAEGVNLHRSNIIVNYDVPWNSTRLMQRIGRVNRIGTKATQIYVYNFYPSAHGDSEIRLINTALRKLQAFHTAFGEDNRIFSVLEELEERRGDNKATSKYGGKLQEEKNETLQYLEELRKFKKEQPKWYQRIEKIPAKSRCGRKLKPENELSIYTKDGVNATYPLNKSSLVYLKSDNHPGVFCFVTPSLNCLEINFLQAIKLFKATMEEKPGKLHDLHYKQATHAMDFFKSEKNQNNIRTISSKNLSSAENKAITNINGLLKLVNTDQKTKVLKRTLDSIRKGVFASKGLPKSLNDFFKTNKFTLQENCESFIDALFREVLDRYDLAAPTEEESKVSPSRGIINPKIVLTQSFT